MAEQAPQKYRWGGKKQPADPETTVPESGGDAGPDASASGETLGVEQAGHYQLKRELARGGQAIVYVAHDTQMGRDVAFKQLLPGGPRDAEERFLQESRVAGQLEHPGVVPVYELGRRADGQLFCAMRLVRGRTLGDALKVEKGRARLKLLSNFVSLCQTIAYAHERGVVHRDIKPDNVMLGSFGETVLLDWGVAKIRGREDETGDMLRAPKIDQRFDGTQEGDVVGTPAYMSPEQALGVVKDINEQSDVYSLGAVLFEILTGRPPFTDKNAVQLLLKIAKDKPPAVLDLMPETPRELAFICERAIEKSKKRRYQTARELAGDIEAFRAGGRVQGVEYSSAQLARRWVLRNLPVAIAILVGLLLLIGAGARIWAENRVARRYLAQALLEKSESDAREQRWSRAAAYAAAARVQDDTAEARWRAAQRGSVEIDPAWRVELPGGVDALAVSRAGKIIAVGFADHTIHLFDDTAKPLRTLEGHEAKLTALAFSPDSQVLISASEDKSVIAWSVEAGERVGKLDADVRVRDAAFSPDGALLALAAQEGNIRLFASDGWEPAGQLDGHDGAVTSVDFSPEGAQLVSSGEDGTLRLWGPLGAGPRAKVPVRMIRGEGHQPATRVSFVGPSTVVSASQDGTVRFFGLDGAQLQRINTSHGAVTTLAVPQKGAIAALGQDSAVFLVDPFTRAPVARLEGEDSPGAIAISADGATLISANRDGRLRLWKVTAAQREVRLQGAADFPGGTALAFSPIGQRVAVGDQSGHIALWDLPKARVAGGMDLLQGPVSSLAFSKDGKYLAASGHEDKGFLFELSSADRVALEGHSDLVNAVAFAPDGTLVATGSTDGSVRLWAVPGGAFKKMLSANGMGAILTVTFSADGALVAAGGEDKMIRVWDVKTGHVTAKMEGSPDAVLAVAFSPHASILASGGRDATIRTWRVSNGKLRSLWPGHGARVWSLSFAPDGETLASASLDATIRFWDVATGREVTRMERTPEAKAIAFSPDGQLLVSTGQKPALQLVELGDKAMLLQPQPELKKQLERNKLRLDGIRLTDDFDALAPVEVKPAKRRR